MNIHSVLFCHTSPLTPILGGPSLVDRHEGKSGRSLWLHSSLREREEKGGVWETWRTILLEWVFREHYKIWENQKELERCWQRMKESFRICHWYYKYRFYWTFSTCYLWRDCSSVIFNFHLAFLATKAPYWDSPQGCWALLGLHARQPFSC